MSYVETCGKSSKLWEVSLQAVRWKLGGAGKCVPTLVRDVGDTRLTCRVRREDEESVCHTRGAAQMGFRVFTLHPHCTAAATCVRLRHTKNQTDHILNRLYAGECLSLRPNQDLKKKKKKGQEVDFESLFHSKLRKFKEKNMETNW